MPETVGEGGVWKLPIASTVHLAKRLYRGW